VSATPDHPTATHSTYSDAEIIEQLKQKLSKSEQLRSNTEQRLQYAELKIRVLEERLRLQRIAKYGPGSEKLPDAQLELLELEPGVSGAEVEAESQRETLPSTPKTKRKHPGRQSLPSNLPRIERVLACAPEQCVCGGCGAETSVIGYEESEQLDVEPAKYFVLVTKREKRACKHCEERGVLAAPLPPRIIEKSLVSGSHRDRHGDQQVCQSPSALSSERDSEARYRTGTEPRNARWLGDACRRVTYTDRRRDAPRVTCGNLHPGR
jgi:hypothetical protein